MSIASVRCQVSRVTCEVSGVEFPFSVRPWVLPDGMLAMDREELMELLRLVIGRGKRLGLDVDAEYIEWLESLEEEDDFQPTQDR